MKIFVPISDQLLSDRAELKGALVPFTQKMLADKLEKERPANWLSENNFLCARQRLNRLDDIDLQA
ncbi:MAG: hypothetical protein ACI9FB_002932 [Candidatus Azotimanducaceae bacterium]|jgi:hypothetical protein